MPMVQMNMFDGSQVLVEAPRPRASLEERVLLLEARLDAIVAAQYAAAVEPDHDLWIGDYTNPVSDR